MSIFPSFLTQPTFLMLAVGELMLWRRGSLPETMAVDGLCMHHHASLGQGNAMTTLLGAWPTMHGGSWQDHAPLG